MSVTMTMTLAALGRELGLDGEAVEALAAFEVAPLDLFDEPGQAWHMARCFEALGGMLAKQARDAAGETLPEPGDALTSWGVKFVRERQEGYRRVNQRRVKELLPYDERPDLYDEVEPQEWVRGHVIKGWTPGDGDER